MTIGNKGITLIEILVALAILIFIIGLVFVGYRYFERNTELEVSAQKIVSVLKTAQTKALASEDDSPYGVHFEENQYVLFKGEIYWVGAEDNKFNQLSSRLRITEISLNGENSDIIFQKISGQTEQYGVIILSSVSHPESLKTISIHSSGQVELSSEEVSCCDTNRLTDGRHVHFDLGWSIQTALNLTLYFPDTPEVTEIVSMADYFNPGLTEFDWSGTISVNGEDQSIRIHTHYLDAVDTQLCIHRSGETNSKPLRILIDDKEIVSYTADGQPSIGFWGGLMEIQ